MKKKRRSDSENCTLQNSDSAAAFFISTWTGQQGSAVLPPGIGMELA